MGNVVGINDPKNPRLSPLRVINPREWQGKPVPDREWLVPGICVRGGATLLNGDGGVGKSLLCLQLQAALALSKPWLGIPTPTDGPTRSLAIYCEDEPEELHRRQYDICRYYSCEMRDLDAAHMLSRVGETNTLMSFSRRGEAGGQITNLYRQVEAMIADLGIEVVIIDTAADTFGGKEIDREEVRTFVQKLRAWAIKSRGTVIITQHPSISGMASGAGSSGSTGWHNSVRSRVYLTQPKRQDDDGDEIPTDERFLKFMKSNYGPKGSKLRLLWKNGVFVTMDEAGPQSIFDKMRTQDVLLDAAADFVKQGIELSPDPKSKGSLVARVRAHGELGRLNHGIIAKAQEALVEGGKLVVVSVKKKDRHTGTLIRPHWMRYPQEQEGVNP